MENNTQNQASPLLKLLNKRNVFILLFMIAIVVLLFFIISRPPTNTNEAKEAIRKDIPNAEVRDLTIADGFAMGQTYVPKDKGQLGSGQLSVFRINKDGSMKHLASASDFNEIALLSLGISLETQSKLTNISLEETKNGLATTCNYDDYEFADLPGFYGFSGSFNPDGWQIDKSTYFYITNVLGKSIESTNINKPKDKKIICVVASTDKSNITVDKSTNIGTFYIKLQFITNDGVITNHDFTFNDDPPSERLYTLDGQKIEIN